VTATVNCNMSTLRFDALTEPLLARLGFILRRARIPQFSTSGKQWPLLISTPCGELSGLTHEFLLFDCIDQIDGGEDAHAAAIVFESLHTDRGCQMGLYGPSPPTGTSLYAEAMNSHWYNCRTGASLASRQLKSKPQTSQYAGKPTTPPGTRASALRVPRV